MPCLTPEGKIILEPGPLMIEDVLLAGRLNWTAWQEYWGPLTLSLAILMEMGESIQCLASVKHQHLRFQVTPRRWKNLAVWTDFSQVAWGCHSFGALSILWLAISTETCPSQTVPNQHIQPDATNSLWRCPRLIQIDYPMHCPHCFAQLLSHACNRKNLSTWSWAKEF